MSHPYPEPDFRAYACSARIDFVTVTRDTRLPFNELRRMGAKVPVSGLPHPYRFPHLATLHDAKPTLLADIDLRAPGCQLFAVEVALDFRPKTSSSHERQLMLDRMHRYLLSRLLPWRGVGLQEAVRVHRKGTKPLVAESSPRGTKSSWEEFSELPKLADTVYFGHRDAYYATDEPNYAFVRLYRKRRDQRRAVRPDAQVVRVEVNLNRAGCAHFGLHRIDDLRTFDFRKLRPYFHLIEPRVAPVVPRKPATKLPRKLLKVLRGAEASTAAAVTESIRQGGAFRMRLGPPALTGHGTGAARGNGKIAEMLDNLSRSFDRATIRP